MGKSIKIAYFPSATSKEVVLGSNGKNITNYCTKCVTDESNGNYVVDMTFTLEASQYLDEENILKVKMDYGYEIFRISKVTKGLRYIDIVARQITIADTLTMWLDDVRPENMNGQNALDWINDKSTSRKKEIIFKSDIDKISTAYYQDMNVYKAISDCDQSFTNRWGGEILRRQYTLSINKRVGIESGVTIREGKNLTGFSGESSIDNLVTRACGKGYNGIKGDYIESPLINNYANIYNSVIEYQDVRVKTDDSTTQEEGVLYFDTEEQAKQELNERIIKEFSENDIDKLKATYTVNFVELERANQYKDYAKAEKVMLGDTIRVYVPKVDTDIKVRVIGKKYDVLAQKTNEITVSNEVIITNITMNSIISELQKVEASTGNPMGDYINAMQRAGLQNSYVVFRENEILLLDTKDINTAKNVVKLNNNGLFFGQNGYYGQFDDGFTIDGIINADHIRTGILTAIIIQNADASMRIDLSQKGGASFYSDDIKALEIKGTKLNFFNWAKNGDLVGSIGSLVYVDEQNNPRPEINSMGIWHDKDAALKIGYKTDNGVKYYIAFDKYKVTGDYEQEINVGATTNFQCPIQFNNDAKINGVQELGSGRYGLGDAINIDGGFRVESNSLFKGNVNILGELYINGVKVYAGTGGGSGSGGTVLTGSWWDIAFDMVGREESGHSDPAMISNISWDAGGKSYGAYQFSLNMGSLGEFVDWLGVEGSAKATNWHNRLSAHALGSDAFDAEWKAIASEDHDGFLHIQQKRMIVAFYKPALNEIAKINPSFVAGNYTVGLNACILSTAIQFGPGGYNSNGSVWSYVFSSLADEPTMLQRFKDSRTAYFSATSERYAREYTATMNMYNTYHPKTFGDGYGSPDGGSALQLAVVNSARKLIGKPYVWGK